MAPRTTSESLEQPDAGHLPTWVPSRTENCHSKVPRADTGPRESPPVNHCHPLQCLLGLSFPQEEGTGHCNPTFLASSNPGLGPSLDQGPLPGAMAKWDVSVQGLRLGWWANEGAPDSPGDLTCLFSGNITSGSGPSSTPPAWTQRSPPLAAPDRLPFWYLYYCFEKTPWGLLTHHPFLKKCSPRGVPMSARLRMWHHRQFLARSSPVTRMSP